MLSKVSTFHFDPWELESIEKTLGYSYQLGDPQIVIIGQGKGRQTDRSVKIAIVVSCRDVILYLSNKIISSLLFIRVSVLSL